jgi:hypothetical protein
VLSLDMLRALSGRVAPLRQAVDELVPDDGTPERATVVAALDAAEALLGEVAADRASMEASARGIAFTLARTMAAALLLRSARWSVAMGDPRPVAASRRFLARGLDRLALPANEDDALLAGAGAVAM